MQNYREPNPQHSVEFKGHRPQPTLKQRAKTVMASFHPGRAAPLRCEKYGVFTFAVSKSRQSVEESYRAASSANRSEG